MAMSADDAHLASRVLKRIDRRLMPLLFFTYMLNFMDKVILSSAAVFGLREDTHLNGQAYSWVASIFYVGYLAMEYPATVLVARLPTAKYLAANTLFWGTVVSLTAACSSFSGLMAVRFLLGVAEASITPGFMFLTSTWYTRDEMPARVGLWFSGNAVGGLVSNLLAFGAGHIQHPLRPWRWMYMILGAVTFLWAVPLFVLLPDSIAAADFLDSDERRVAEARVAVAGTGSTARAAWEWDQVRECLADAQAWLICGISLLVQMPNGGTQGFANIILQSFDFTELQSTLVNIPYSLLTASVIAAAGYTAGRFRGGTCLLIVVVILPCIAGSVVIYCRSNVPRAVQLLAYFMLSTGTAAMPLAMALVQSNFRGVTKKMTVTAMQFIAYSVGNMAGPQLFRHDEAPTYESAFRAIIVTYSLAVALALVLRLYLQGVNGRRSRREGFEGSAGAAGGRGPGPGPTQLLPEGHAVTASSPESRAAECQDLTDWKAVGFRYRL